MVVRREVRAMRRYLAIASIIIAAVLLLGLALLAEQSAHAPAIGRVHIEQQSVALAETQFDGEITAVAAQYMNLGDMPLVARCSLVTQAYRATLATLGLASLNVCDPTSGLWRVRLAGTFRHPGGTGQSMEMLWHEDGSLAGTHIILPSD